MGRLKTLCSSRCHPWSFGTRRRGRFFAAAAATARADRLGARQRLVPARRRRLGRVLRSRQVAARRRAALRETWSVGGGIGYQINSWFRTDVTADWRNDAKFFGVNSGSNYVNGYSIDNGKIESSTLLLNGYIDFGAGTALRPMS